METMPYQYGDFLSSFNNMGYNGFTIKGFACLV
jgi:hypothetical protein